MEDVEINLAVAKAVGREIVDCRDKDGVFPPPGTKDVVVIIRPDGSLKSWGRGPYEPLEDVEQALEELRAYQDRFDHECQVELARSEKSSWHVYIDNWHAVIDDDLARAICLAIIEAEAHELKEQSHED